MIILFYERELHKENQKISKIIDEEDQKVNKFKKRYKERKQKFASLFQQDNSIIDSEKEEEIEKDEKNKKKKKFRISHFIGVNLKSIKDIEKKKMELLYKIKHDIKYKISRGEINMSEIDNFNKFQTKINGLKKEYEDFNIELYVKQLEEYFSSYEDEITNKERKKIDEDRINNYLRRLKDYFNDNDRLRRINEEKLCKVIDFHEINHINTLNDTKIYEGK